MVSMFAICLFPLERMLSEVLSHQHVLGPHRVFTGLSVLSPHLHPLSTPTDPLRPVPPIFSRSHPPLHLEFFHYKDISITLLSTLYFQDACFHSGSCFLLLLLFSLSSLPFLLFFLCALPAPPSFFFFVC